LLRATWPPASWASRTYFDKYKDYL